MGAHSQSDVVVVGAGLAGLMAARVLRRAGRSVQVVEARDRVGGRTFTRPFAGDVVDVGGTWVGPTQTRVLALAQELGIATDPQRAEGKSLMQVGERMRAYRGTIPALNVIALIELQRAIGRIDRMARQVPAHSPQSAPRARAWDSLTVGAYVDAEVRTRGARDTIAGAVRAIFSSEPREVSLLYFLWYVRCAGGIMPLCEVEGGAQERRLRGGAQQLSERLAEGLDERLALGRPVRAISQDDAGVRVHTEAGTFEGRRLIVAVPPHLCARIDWQPAMPAVRDQLCQRMPIGASIKVITAYQRPFWRDAGYSGEAVCNRGPVSLVFDVGRAEGGPGLLMSFMLGDAARAMTDRGPAAREAAVVRALEGLFGPPAGAPEAVIEHDWMADPWARGCSVGIGTAGALTTCGDAVRAPVGRIHFAGTETATRWAGFMDGALESGERAAQEVLDAL
ncbi:MAG: FAD-dependent oxidoreductase [Deltaproteobacteria bacterium]|nr:FAD-dependent oxidoreductase [Deltaproteobacteria bacterium]MCB9788387.1 FAD-dependent oxidoreductase [Deltaproteobacteria bacterium]